MDFIKDPNNVASKGKTADSRGSVHPLDQAPTSMPPITQSSSGTSHGRSGGTSTPSQAHGENMAAGMPHKN